MDEWPPTAWGWPPTCPHPTLPLKNTEIDAAQMRGQLTALKALLDAQKAVIVAQAAQIATQAAQLTALNPNVGTFNISLSEPPLRAEVQAMLDFTNALSTSLTRV